MDHEISVDRDASHGHVFSSPWRCCCIINLAQGQHTAQIAVYMGTLLKKPPFGGRILGDFSNPDFMLTIRSFSDF